MAGTGRGTAARGLPLGVRLMRRISGRGLPRPACPVAVEHAIEVPAADGVILLTDHYMPLTSAPAPTLLVRTPYGRGFPWDFLYGALFAGHGFHVVIQSCRGTGGSGGSGPEYEPCRSERADGQAAVAWLRRQPWFSGTLGTIGSSYLGYVQWALAADPPPELAAMVVQNGVHDLYGLLFPGGAFALEDALNAAASLSMDRGFGWFLLAMLRLLRHHRRTARVLPLLDAYPPALGGRVGWFEEWLRHPDPGDQFWQGLDAGAAADGLKVPTSLVTGWYDICLDQTLTQYHRLVAAGCEVSLLIGCWTHTSGFSADLPVTFGDALAWLRAHLCGDGDAPAQPVRVQVGGSRGQWRDLPSWPPQTITRHWYLHPAGRLASVPVSAVASSAIHYDPAAPTPSAGGPILNDHTAGVVANNPIESRPDVLTFTSPPLTGDLEVLGPVGVSLQVRASGPHFDVFARLCDVDQRGRSHNVCDGLIRHRPGGGAPGHGEAGGGAVTVPLSSTAYRFAAGHRLRLQVSGGAHPRFARNTGTGEPPATATRLASVDIEILHGAEWPGSLSLPVAAEDYSASSTAPVSAHAAPSA